MTETAINVTEFKAKCLRLLDQVGRGDLSRLVVTKRGRPLAVVVAPSPAPMRIEDLYGWQRGSVVMPPDVDLTAPIADEPWDAEAGILHR